MEINKIYQGDCFEIMREISDNSIDAIITDPPYGLGMANWDKPIDIKAFMIEVKRILNPNGFLAFFAQMPTMVDWLNQANEFFKYKEHITWIKRIVLPSKRFSRSHEDIFIYSKGNSTFYKTKGLYSDIKPPGLYFDITTIQSIKRYIAAVISGKNIIPPDTNSQATYKRFRVGSNRCPEYCNYTNVWSFLPPAFVEKNGKYWHPTEKSIKVMERLIEILSAKNMLILDPFVGSGTTAIACIRTKRNYIGIDISEEYCQIARERIAAETNQLQFSLEVLNESKNISSSTQRQKGREADSC